MSDPRLTEERLRTWLNSQAEQERLCVRVLTLDTRFYDVKPRRPKGGPDGARDIEAVHESGYTVWGAVGFRKNVTDSSGDKKWAAKKFEADLTSALDENPDLWGFVFFTNVDLTPGEVAKLQTLAKAKGIRFVEIFYRERLKIALESPRGLGLRFQYLGIALSEAEQQAFFAEYGQQLEAMLLENFDTVGRRLTRLEFLQECSRPLKRIDLILALRRPHSPDELGHFRFMAQLLALQEAAPHPMLAIAGRDSYSIWQSGSASEHMIGIQTLAWRRHPDSRLQTTSIGTTSIAADHLHAWGSLVGEGTHETLGMLDGRVLSIYITRPLFELTEAIYLVANDFLIAGGRTEHMVALDQQLIEPWPDPLTDEEQQVPWVSVFMKVAEPTAIEPGWPYWAIWHLDFARYTPERVIVNEATAISLHHRAFAPVAFRAPRAVEEEN